MESSAGSGFEMNVFAAISGFPRTARRGRFLYRPKYRYDAISLHFQAEMISVMIQGSFPAACSLARALADAQEENEAYE